MEKNAKDFLADMNKLVGAKSKKDNIALISEKKVKLLEVNKL